MYILFPYSEKVKEKKCIWKEQYSLVIIETFKGQDNDVLKVEGLCDENFCEVAITLQNLTNKFQPFDINKLA